MKEQVSFNNIPIESVVTDKFCMDYFKFGRGEKTLVILPGLSVQSVMNFANRIAEAYGVFCDDYTVFVLDRRKNLPSEYSVSDMANDTAAAISKLGLKRINLFGTSQGGMIAMEIAVNYPELMQSLILGSTAVRVSKKTFSVIERWINFAKDKMAYDLLLSFGKTIYPNIVFENLKSNFSELSKTVTEEDLWRFTVFARGIRDFDESKNLEKISCPVMVIGDKKDELLGKNATGEIVKCLKRTDKTEIFDYDGYGHAVYDIAPDYKTRIYNFLRNIAE